MKNEPVDTKGFGALRTLFPTPIEEVQAEPAAPTLEEVLAHGDEAAQDELGGDDLLDVQTAEPPAPSPASHPLELDPDPEATGEPLDIEIAPEANPWGEALAEELGTLKGEAIHPNEELINEVLSYIGEDYRAAEYERLSRLDARLLRSLLETMQTIVGPAADHVRSLNVLYAARLSDPAHRVTLSAFEESGSAYDKLATNVARAISNEPLVHAITNGDFRQAARDNVNALATLSGMIRSMETPLAKYLSRPLPSQEDLAMPASLGHLMNVLRHATAHLQSAHSLSTSLEEQIVEARNEAANLRERLRVRSSEIEGLRDAPAFHTGPRFLRNRRTGECLANSIAPTGRITGRLPYHRMHWTLDLDAALKFKDEAHVMTTVQRWIDRATARHRNTAWDETLLGVPVLDLTPAELCIRNR